MDMHDADPVKVILPVLPPTRDALGRIAAERSRTTGKPVSVVSLLREAVAAHFKIDVPAVTPHRRALRHRA